MKTTIDQFNHLLPAPEVLYRLASRHMRRSLALDEGKIPDCTSGSSSERLRILAVRYIQANGGR